MACDVAHLACMACSVAPIVGVHVQGIGGEIETIACDLARPACSRCAAKQAAAEASASTTGAAAQ